MKYYITIICLLLGFKMFSQELDSKLLLDPTMVDDPESATLLDEQQLAGDPAYSPGGIPLSFWKGETNEVIIDLNSEYQISKVLLFDGKNEGNVKLYYLRENSFHLLVNDDLKALYSWNHHDVSIITQIIKVVKVGKEAEVGELVIYGQKVFDNSIAEQKPQNNAKVGNQPIANSDFYTIRTSAVKKGNVSLNDAGLDDLPVKYRLKKNANGGNLVLNSDGTFEYTPRAGYNWQQDFFVYQVRDVHGDQDEGYVFLKVQIPDYQPDAVDDKYVTNDGKLYGKVSNNDLHISDAPVTYSIVNNVSTGSLLLQDDGSFQYIAPENFNGTIDFSYKVMDADGDYDQANVYITIGSIASDLTAYDESITMYSNSTYNGDLSPKINSTTSLSFKITNDAKFGTVSLTSRGTYAYTPNDGFSGSDSFTYRVTDANGNFDDGTVSISVTVKKTDSKPSTRDDFYTMDTGTSYAGNVSDNDSGLEDQPVVYELIRNVNGGSMTLNEDGSFTYVPRSDYNNKQDYGKYKVTDADGDYEIGVIYIKVCISDHLPLAKNDNYKVEKDLSLSNDISKNDSGLEDGPVKFTITKNVSSGTLSFNQDGTFKYVPNSGFIGKDQFSYLITDADGDNSDAVVYIEVINPVADYKPVATNDNLSLEQDTYLSGNVTLNDSGLEDTPITSTITKNASNGQLSLSKDGSFTYYPNPGYSGQDQFTYRITDNDGDYAEAVVSLTINPVVSSSSVPNIIFDTDLGSDCDDAGALATLHKLADYGEANILGVIFSSGKVATGIGTIDAINTYYKRGDLPIGQYALTDVGDSRDDYLTLIGRDTRKFGHNLVNKSTELVQAYKQMMKNMPNNSVTIVTVGHPHGLVHLMRDTEGMQLIKSKVKMWVAVTNTTTIPRINWNFGRMGSQVYLRELIKNWPRPFYVSGDGEFKTGHRKLPATSNSNPVKIAYDNWHSSIDVLRDGRESWDQVGVLFAVRPEYFDVDSNGRYDLDSTDKVYWNQKYNNSQHHRVFIKLSDDKIAGIVEDLMSAPPK